MDFWTLSKCIFHVDTKVFIGKEWGIMIKRDVFRQEVDRIVVVMTNPHCQLNAFFYKKQNKTTFVMVFLHTKRTVIFVIASVHMRNI